MLTVWKPQSRKPFARNVGGVSRIVRDSYHTDKATWWDTCKEIRLRDQGKCFYCGCVENPKGPLHDVHHIIPISRGGTTTPRNLILACTKKSGNGCHEKRHKHMR